MKDQSKLWVFGGATLFTVCAPIAVVAADYMSVEAAQRAAFKQADRFDEISVALTTEQQRAILLLAGPQPQHGKLHVFHALQGAQSLGYLFVDEVIGRQDLITYAIAIDNAGKLGEVEILSYRESHGNEVRNSGWRKQFSNRNSLDKLRFTIDIKNIAGATLSCEHITQGVRWVFALWQTMLQESHS